VVIIDAKLPDLVHNVLVVFAAGRNQSSIRDLDLDIVPIKKVLDRS
jgi:hypothetical protein